MIKLFNFYYFFYIAAAAVTGVMLFFILNKKSIKTVKIIVFSVLLSSFCLHFLKLFFEPYKSEFPFSVRKSTFENICAVSTLIFPFIFISNSKYWKDYMFYLGTISGFLALIIPTEALNKPAFVFDTIRFYYCHFVIIISSLLMVLLSVHKLDYRRNYKVPLLLLAVLCLIMINQTILAKTGFIEGGFDRLFDPNRRNSSLIFGPPEKLKKYMKLLTALTPKLFLTVPVGPDAGKLFYWPVLWMAVPLFIYLNLLCFLICLPFQYKTIVKDYKKLNLKLKSLQH